MNTINFRVFLRTITDCLICVVVCFVLLLLIAHQAYAVPLKLSDNIKAVWSDKRGLDGGFVFVVIGDTRDNDKVFLSLLDKTKSFDPLFIVNVGDFVNSGTTKQYDHYSQSVADFGIPILNVAGNHDVKSGKSVFQRYIGNLNWYFDYGAYRFIALDNSTGVFTKEAEAFAGKYITSEKTCFVFFHCPPPYERWAVHSMSGTMKTARTAAIISKIEEGKSAAVFMGHLHMYDENKIGGVPYIISGGGGAELNKKYGFGIPEHGFVIVRVSGEGISHEWVGMDS